MSASESFRAGRLDEAIAAATDQVKHKPNDAGSRGFLAELQCFAGQLDKADRQLDVLSEQDPETAVGIAMFRQLIRAEQARQQFFSDGRLPEFLDQPDKHSSSTCRHRSVCGRARKRKPPSC